MSSSDDAAARLSSALEGIFSGASPSLSGRGEVPVDADPPTADWSVDDEDDDEDERERERESDGPEVLAEPAAAADGDALASRREPIAGDDPYVLPRIVPATLDPPPPPVPVPEPAPASEPAREPAIGRPATSWSDHLTTTPTATGPAGLRAPGRRPRVRRVTRVVRHIDPWTTFKVSLVFSAVAYVVMLTAGVLLWRVADSTGTLDNVERWFTQFGWETFELKGGEIFHNAWIIGLFGVVAMTGGLVLLATLFNLVSDIVGGIRVTVLEEEVVERTISSTRRYVVRRTPADVAASASAQDWTVDDGSPDDDDWSVDDDGPDTG